MFHVSPPSTARCWHVAMPRPRGLDPPSSNDVWPWATRPPENSENFGALATLSTREMCEHDAIWFDMIRVLSTRRRTKFGARNEIHRFGGSGQAWNTCRDCICTGRIPIPWRLTQNLKLILWKAKLSSKSSGLGSIIILCVQYRSVASHESKNVDQKDQRASWNQ